MRRPATFSIAPLTSTVQAERASVGSGTLDNEVEAPAVVHSLAGDTYPGPLDKLLARLASRPVLGHAKAWSPRASTISPHLGLGPQRLAQSGSAKRRRRLKATCIACGGRVVVLSQGIAVSHAPACGPA